MRFRLAAAPSASYWPRRRLVRVCVTCAGPVPGSTCVYWPTRNGTRGPAIQLVALLCTDAVNGVDLARAHRAPTSISLARNSASVRRPRPGATSVALNSFVALYSFSNTDSCFSTSVPTQSVVLRITN